VSTFNVGDVKQVDVQYKTALRNSADLVTSWGISESYYIKVVYRFLDLKKTKTKLLAACPNVAYVDD